MADTTDKTTLHIVLVAEAVSGGVARQLAQLAECLPAPGWRVSLLLGRRPGEPSGDAPARIAASGCHVETIPVLRRSLWRPDRDLAAYRALRQALARLAPDVVHTHAAKAGFLGRLAAFRLGLPAIHTPHVFPFERAGRPAGRFYAELERLAAHWCVGTLCLNNAQRDAALARGVGDSAGLRLLPNAVDIDKFRPPTPAERARARQSLGLPPDGRVLGYLGRFQRQKDIGLLLSAVRPEDATAGGFTLLLGGGDAGGLAAPSAPALRRNDGVAARRPPAAGRRPIVCVGEVSGTLSFYHALDGFVLPSRWEGCPYVLLEALACGLPVIATATRGAASLLIPEHFPDGRRGRSLPVEAGVAQWPAGWTVGVGDAAALRRAIDLWRRRPPEDLARRGRAARRIAEAHPLPKWIEALRGIYRQAAGYR